MLWINWLSSGGFPDRGTTMWKHSASSGWIRDTVWASIANTGYIVCDGHCVSGSLWQKQETRRLLMPRKRRRWWHSMSGRLRRMENVPRRISTSVNPVKAAMVIRSGRRWLHWRRRKRLKMLTTTRIWWGRFDADSREVWALWLWCVLIQLLISALYQLFVCLLSFLIYFLLYVFISLLVCFFQNRPVLYPGWRSQEVALVFMCIVCLKTIHLTFDHNFGKSGPIFKIISLSDSWRNFIRKYHKVSPCLKYVSTVPCETWKSQLLPILMTYCMWDLKN